MARKLNRPIAPLSLPGLVFLLAGCAATGVRSDSAADQEHNAEIKRLRHELKRTRGELQSVKSYAERFSKKCRELDVKHFNAMMAEGTLREMLRKFPDVIDKALEPLMKAHIDATVDIGQAIISNAERIARIDDSLEQSKEFAKLRIEFAAGMLRLRIECAQARREMVAKLKKRIPNE